MKKFVSVLALGMMISGAAFAAQPNPASNPVMAAFQKTGIKFYYLGKAQGLDGWFLIKDGQIQVLYATPDNKGALNGTVLGPNGENITENQVAELLQNHREIAAQMQAAAAQANAATVAPVQPAQPPAAAPAAPAAAPVAAPAPAASQPAAAPAVTTPAPAVPAAPAQQKAK